MIGGQRDPHLAALDETGLIATARQGLANTMGITQAPEVTMVRVWPKGIPNYPLGHLARVERIFSALAAWPGLELTSNAYHGIALNDCVASAEACVARLP